MNKAFFFWDFLSFSARKEVYSDFKKVFKVLKLPALLRLLKSEIYKRPGVSSFSADQGRVQVSERCDIVQQLHTPDESCVDFGVSGLLILFKADAVIAKFSCCSRRKIDSFSGNFHSLQCVL